MDAISGFLQNLTQNAQMEAAEGGLVLLLAFLPPLVFYFFRVRAGHKYPLRPLKPYQRLKALMSRALETGQTIHVSMGVAGLGGQNTAETIAGLTALRHLTRHPAVDYVAPLATVSDPTLLPAAQDALRRGYEQQGIIDRFETERGRLIAPSRGAYAAGVMDLLEGEDLHANVMIGSFSDEFLLMGEVAAQRGIEQVAGTADPQTLPFLFVTADYPLLGEEMFAAGAYLSELPAHIGSLKAQDWIRVILGLVILGGVVLKTLGIIG